MTTCPECGSANTKEHRPRGALASNFGYKCNDCGHTFKFGGNSRTPRQ